MFDGGQDGDTAKDRPFSAKTLAAAAAMHAVLFAALFYRHFSEPEKPEKIEVVPIDMTVVVHENLDKPEDDLKPVDKPKPPEPPKPRPKPPEPPKPPKPPAVEPPKNLPAVTIDKPKPPEKKPPEKKPAEKKPPEPKPPEKKPPEKPKFVRGKPKTLDHPQRQLPPRVPARPPDVRAALGGNGPRTQQRMPDVDKWLALGARPGTVNAVTDNEAARCYGLIKRQFHDRWNPPAADSSLRKPHIRFRLDRHGTISRPSVVKSSGSKEVDDSALAALRSLGRFTGLSQEFISKSGGEFTIELEIR